MKSKLLLSILFLGAFYQSNAQNVLSSMKPRPADYENLSSPDSLGIRHQLLMPNIENRNTLANQSLPYPIIFIHGLDSDCTVWGNNVNTDLMYNSLLSYGLTYGGRFDFNLNDDNSNSTSNKLFYPTPGADISQWSTTLVNADYYFLNFAVGSDGSFAPSNISTLNVLSNEASIAKQGVALTRTIQQVLNITGRDKVILMGHSMGGLAAREYLQNPENWTEPNINHHVAKLITTGTPHGGYTGANFILTGINSSSEAYRDLRAEYSNNNVGVFLFGGVESNSNIGTSYYNNDINCNGINNDNSTILGLNQKNLFNNLDYAYIMGNCSGCVITQGSILGDGVVRLANANLSNYYFLPNPKNEFIYSASAVSQIHTDLPKAIGENMQALDEPNVLGLAYGVDYNKTYKGFIFKQPVGGNVNDYDNYKFTVTTNSQISILINNITSQNLYAVLYNSSGNQLSTNYSGNSTTNINLIQNLTPGNYFLQIYSVAPTTTSNIYPYNFILTSTLSNTEFNVVNKIELFPNPTTSKVFFDNSSSNFKEVAIYNYLGQEVSKTGFTSISNNQEVDMSGLSAGVYILKFSNTETSQSVKVVKQ